MRALAGLLCGLLGLVPGAAAYEPDVFGTAGQVAGQAVYDLGGSGLPCRGGPPPTELSLEEAIERILCHDPQTRLAWANAKAQAAQVGIGKSAYLPRLDGRLDASRGYSDMDYRDAPYLSGDGHRHRRGASLQLSWVLFDFGRRSAALRNAQQLLLAANASQDATLQNTFALAAQATTTPSPPSAAWPPRGRSRSWRRRTWKPPTPSTGPAPPPFPIACRRRPRCPRRASPRSATKAP
ncbi:hypothetical protein AXH09_02160 [Pseudomonas aeruginosa]|nr:hypothetical protein AXH09_02160 [Pseudomonas aeruginosa]